MTIALTVGGGYVILLITKYGKDTSHGGFKSLVSLHVAIYTTCILSPHYGWRLPDKMLQYLH